MQLSGIVIDAERAGASQLVFAVTTTQQTDRKHSGPARGQQIPNCVTHNKAFVNRHAQPLLTVKEQVWSGLGSLHVTAFDYQCFGAYTKRV